MVSRQGLAVVHALHECPSLHETMSQDVSRPVSTNKYQRRVWNLTITVTRNTQDPLWGNLCSLWAHVATTSAIHMEGHVGWLNI